MTGARLLVLLVLGQAPAADPIELVQGLGAARYADRESASRALERLGRLALPALRSARDQKDPEIRTRAAALFARIEGALLTQPTLVSLNFHDAPLAEVVKSLSEQTGVKVMLIPENSPAWLSRRVTLREPAPLPFWKAVDRVCEAARLQFNHGNHSFANGREPSLPLFEATGRSTLPVSDSGPFRVSLVGLHFQRDVSFPPAPVQGRGAGDVGPPGAMVNEQFYAQFHVAGEPQLSLAQRGPLRVVEAVDDKGQALVLPDSDGPPSHRASGYFGFAAGSVLPIQMAMSRPPQPGTTIRRLKGVIPVTVSTRKPDPLTISLASAAGRTFRNDEVSLTVHDVRPMANERAMSIEVTVRSLRGASSGSSPSLGGNDVPLIRPDLTQQQIEVTDAQGRPIPWYQTSFDAEAGRLTLTLAGVNPGATPAELRYFSLIRASTEVGFEFADVRLP